MKAAAAMSPGVVKAVDLPMPQVREYECLVKFRACGFCATDIKIIENHLSNMTVKYPVILGHEGIGQVVEVGTKAKSYKVGDLIMAPHGRVPAETGFTRMWGHMMEYGVVQDKAVMAEMGIDKSEHVGFGPVLPADLDPIDASVLLALCEAYSGIINFGIVAGMNVLIYGDGPIGLALANFARMRGATWVGTVGHHDSRLDRIRQLGNVDAVINSSKQEVPAHIGDRKFDVVIDAVGSMRIIKEATRLCKPRGKVGVYGVVHAPDATMSILDLQNNTSLHMLNWPHGEGNVRDEMIDMFRAGTVRPRDYFTDVMPLARIEEAYQKIKARQTFRITVAL